MEEEEPFVKVEEGEEPFVNLKEEDEPFVQLDDSMTQYEPGEAPKEPENNGGSKTISLADSFKNEDESFVNIDEEGPEVFDYAQREEEEPPRKPSSTEEEESYILKAFAMGEVAGFLETVCKGMGIELFATNPPRSLPYDDFATAFVFQKGDEQNRAVEASHNWDVLIQEVLNFFKDYCTEEAKALVSQESGLVHFVAENKDQLADHIARTGARFGVAFENEYTAVQWIDIRNESEASKAFPSRFICSKDEKEACIWKGETGSIVVPTGVKTASEALKTPCTVLCVSIARTVRFSEIELEHANALNLLPRADEGNSKLVFRSVYNQVNYDNEKTSMLSRATRRMKYALSLCSLSVGDTWVDFELQEDTLKTALNKLPAVFSVCVENAFQKSDKNARKIVPSFSPTDRYRCVVETPQFLATTKASLMGPPNRRSVASRNNTFRVYLDLGEGVTLKGEFGDGANGVTLSSDTSVSFKDKMKDPPPQGFKRVYLESSLDLPIGWSSYFGDWVKKLSDPNLAHTVAAVLSCTRLGVSKISDALIESAISSLCTGPFELQKDETPESRDEKALFFARQFLEGADAFRSPSFPTYSSLLALVGSSNVVSSEKRASLEGRVVVADPSASLLFELEAKDSAEERASPWNGGKLSDVDLSKFLLVAKKKPPPLPETPLLKDFESTKDKYEKKETSSSSSSRVVHKKVVHRPKKEQEGPSTQEKIKKAKELLAKKQKLDIQANITRVISRRIGALPNEEEEEPYVDLSFLNDDEDGGGAGGDKNDNNNAFSPSPSPSPSTDEERKKRRIEDTKTPTPAPRRRMPSSAPSRTIYDKILNEAKITISKSLSQRRQLREQTAERIYLHMFEIASSPSVKTLDDIWVENALLLQWMQDTAPALYDHVVLLAKKERVREVEAETRYSQIIAKQYAQKMLEITDSILSEIWDESEVKTVLKDTLPFELALGEAESKLNEVLWNAGKSGYTMADYANSLKMWSKSIDERYSRIEQILNEIKIRNSELKNAAQEYVYFSALSNASPTTPSGNLDGRKPLGLVKIDWVDLPEEDEHAGILKIVRAQLAQSEVEAVLLSAEHKAYKSIKYLVTKLVSTIDTKAKAPAAKSKVKRKNIYLDFLSEDDDDNDSSRDRAEIAKRTKEILDLTVPIDSLKMDDLAEKVLKATEEVNKLAATSTQTVLIDNDASSKQTAAILIQKAETTSAKLRDTIATLKKTVREELEKAMEQNKKEIETTRKLVEEQKMKISVLFPDIHKAVNSLNKARDTLTEFTTKRLEEAYKKYYEDFKTVRKKFYELGHTAGLDEEDAYRVWFGMDPISMTPIKFEEALKMLKQDFTGFTEYLKTVSHVAKDAPKSPNPARSDSYISKHMARRLVEYLNSAFFLAENSNAEGLDFARARLCLQVAANIARSVFENNVIKSNLKTLSEDVFGLTEEMFKCAVYQDIRARRAIFMFCTLYVRRDSDLVPSARLAMLGPMNVLLDKIDQLQSIYNETRNALPAAYADIFTRFSNAAADAVQVVGTLSSQVQEISTATVPLFLDIRSKLPEVLEKRDRQMSFQDAYLLELINAIAYLTPPGIHNQIRVSGQHVMSGAVALPSNISRAQAEFQISTVDNRATLACLGLDHLRARMNEWVRNHTPR